MFCIKQANERKRWTDTKVILKLRELDSFLADSDTANNGIRDSSDFISDDKSPVAPNGC